MINLLSRPGGIHTSSVGTRTVHIHVRTPAYPHTFDFSSPHSINVYFCSCGECYLHGHAKHCVSNDYLLPSQESCVASQSAAGKQQAPKLPPSFFSRVIQEIEELGWDK